MHELHAEQIKTMALELHAETAQMIGPSVHITFRELGPEAEEVGHAAVRVSLTGVHLSHFAQSPCPHGAQWARQLAPRLARLDGAGRQGWQKH
jgi:hypothetical protein